MLSLFFLCRININMNPVNKTIVGKKIQKEKIILGFLGFTIVALLLIVLNLNKNLKEYKTQKEIKNAETYTQESSTSGDNSDKVIAANEININYTFNQPETMALFKFLEKNRNKKCLWVGQDNWALKAYIGNEKFKIVAKHKDKKETVSFLGTKLWDYIWKEEEESGAKFKPKYFNEVIDNLQDNKDLDIDFQTMISLITRSKKPTCQNFKIEEDMISLPSDVSFVEL